MAEHPFAVFVRILGKGKSGSRSLTQAQASEAMAMILRNEVRPEQLGAFLMLLRVKEESPEELAGFVQAARDFTGAPMVPVDLDWSCYAGKKRRLPWFLLAALTLAGEGVRIFMHGARGHTPGRLYVEDVLNQFAIAPCQDWQQVETALAQQHFAFMGIDQLVPGLGHIIQLRPVLGLRSPVHTLCRLLNPLRAPATVDGVFHPAYAPLHQQASQLLGVQHSLTIRGDGGEAELRPDSDCEVRWIKAGQLADTVWPRLLPRRELNDSALNPADLLALWRDEISHPYGEAAVLSTLAAVLVLLGRADQQDAALALARQCWQRRDRQAYG